MGRSDGRETERIRAYYREASWDPSEGRQLLVAERRASLERFVNDRLPPLEAVTVCDVGCGAGADLARWAELGVAPSGLFGTELVEERAAAARARLPGASVATVGGFEIPHPDASIDLVTASLVLSSILDPAGRQALLTEMRRVTKPSGVVAIYDFRIRKPWNRNVVAIRAGELRSVLGEPAVEHRLAPFLPLLDVALRLPGPLRGAAIAMLPRTHRLWIWDRGN